MTEEERIELDRLQEECEFFQSKGKPKRELFIAEKFLKQLGEKIESSKLMNATENGLVDIIYSADNDEAKFEIKIIPNVFFENVEGKEVLVKDKVTDAYKRLLIAIMECREKDIFDMEKLMNALNYQFMDKAYDIKYVDGYNLLKEEVSKITQKYKGRETELKNVDLLIYCLRHHVEGINKNDIRYEDFERHGWRSISCLMRDKAIVLYVSAGPPVFLKNAHLKF